MDYPLQTQNFEALSQMVRMLDAHSEGAGSIPLEGPFVRPASKPSPSITRKNFRVWLKEYIVKKGHSIFLLSHDITKYPNNLETAMSTKVNAQKDHSHPYVKAVHRMNELSFLFVRMPLFWLKPIWYASGYGKEYDQTLLLVKNFTKKVIFRS